MSKPPLLVIAGPTASGKTALSIKCALKYNGEVVSADSMQIYKGMDIATAKPSFEEMQGVRHHLIDFLDIDKSYSVADFTCDANKAVFDILSRDMLPILVGGTGLYIDSFVNNIQFTDTDTDFKLRNKLTERIETIGAEKMLEELAEFDPESAKRLHPSNKKRIVRAFEVYMLTGKTFSQTVKESRAEPSPYDVTYIGINYKNRDILYERINRRVDIMLENGLVDEAMRYFKTPKKKTASQAIGYKELKPWLDGEISFEKAVDNLKTNTRHYAKRQLTWFNRNEAIHWFYADEYDNFDDFYNDIYKYLDKRVI